MADDGTPRNPHDFPSRNARRSNEGGRVVEMAAGKNPLGYGSSPVAADPMRMDADEMIPGAGSDEGVLNMVEMAAERIARLHPDHQKRVDSVAAKLKAAVQALS